LENATGGLVIGSQAAAGQTDFIDPRFQNVTNLPTGGRVNTDGLWDVRVFDATGFTSGINIGATLTEQSFDRYLDKIDPDAEFVQFSYLGGDGGNLFTFRVDGDLASDPDFRMEIVGGASNDRFNLVGDGFDLFNIEINGGGGDFNTLETSSSIGIDAASTPMTFENIQKLVLAGDNDVDAGMGVLPGVEELWIATEGGVNSRIYNLNTAETTAVISGKNQTAAPGDSNNNQFFGTISFLGSIGEDATITLDNTARNDGILVVDTLVIDDLGPVQSEIRNLTIESGGSRNTFNNVENFFGARVTTLNFEGSQSIGFHVNNMATLPAAGGTPPLTISGAGLGLDEDGVFTEGVYLDLGLNAANLNRGNLDVIEGTEGDLDWLALYGQLGSTQNPTVSDFELIQFGWLPGTYFDFLFDQTADFTGTYNAINTTGVETYRVGSLNGTFSLINLKNNDTVELGDVTGNNGQVIGNFGQVINLAGAGTLNLHAEAVLDVVNFNVGGASPFDLYINGFTTFNADIDRSNSIVDEDLYASLFTADSVRTINLTGGNADPNVDITLELENPLNTVLTLIDVSGFEGEFRSNGWDSQFGTNATVVVNSYNFQFDLLGTFGDTVTLFEDQLGVDYIAGDNFQLEVLGVIEGVVTPTAIFNHVAVGADYQAILLDLAAAVDGQTSVWNGYTITYNAAYEFNNFTVSIDVEDADGAPVSDAFITDFRFFNSATGLDLNQGDAVSNFITSFQFAQDANEFGVVWQIDNFQGFNEADISLSNQSRIDLRPLGVDDATDITITAGDVYFAGLSAAQIADYAANGFDANAFNFADNTVVTSNEGLDFTIFLPGVNTAELANENFAGIA
jgi:hypothetical protein